MSIEYNSLENVPENLNAGLFGEVLENSHLTPDICLKKISFEKGCEGGENYCSQIYRVKLTYAHLSKNLEMKSVIAKSIFTANAALEFLNDAKVYFKEKIFYFNILPRLEILMGNIKLGPKLFYAVREPINTLVFEDLCSLGYMMLERDKGLDLPHCEMVMKKLGQFHASSMVFQSRDPEALTLFHSGIFAEDFVYKSPTSDAVFGGHFQGLIDAMADWEGFEKIREKLQDLAKDLKPNVIKSQLPIPGELKVLNHGDLWVNNLMFKYAGDTKDVPEDVVFLDFQFSIYGSPGFDINYLFYSSMQLDVLKTKRQFLLRTYHASLCETLKLLRFKDIPSFDNILTEVRRRESFGFHLSYSLFPMMGLDKSKSQDSSLTNIIDNSFAKNFVKVLFSSKRCEETLKYTMKRFDELGVI